MQTGPIIDHKVVLTDVDLELLDFGLDGHLAAALVGHGGLAHLLFLLVLALLRKALLGLLVELLGQLLLVLLALLFGGRVRAQLGVEHGGAPAAPHQLLLLFVRLRVVLLFVLVLLVLQEDAHVVHLLLQLRQQSRWRSLHDNRVTV